jgi:hypothetical protein
LLEESVVSERESFPVADITGLEYSLSEEGCLIYDASQARVHFLNLSAYFVLLSCDGKTGREAMAAALQEAFELAVAPVAEVDACLSTLREIGLLAGQDSMAPTSA